MVTARSLTDLQKQCSPARILAVSKLQSEEKIRALYAEGQRDFAENYVQELLQKQERLKDLKDIRWHFIGHLQRNKVKNIVGRVELMHSLDSIELAETLDHQAEKLQQPQKVLIEVNLAGEQSKSGFGEDEVRQFWSLLCKFPHLEIRGLMTMPPLAEDPETARPYFRRLKSLRDELNSTTPPPHALSELSMGTSGDYAVALQEGATIVRLGTILFGERTAKS
jgi:pyridoxal phosphate enzyme (YggS family)